MWPECNITNKKTSYVYKSHFTIIIDDFYMISGDKIEVTATQLYFCVSENTIELWDVPLHWLNPTVQQQPFWLLKSQHPHKSAKNLVKI